MWVYESGAGTLVSQSAYRHQKIIGSLLPCKFWGSSLDCQAWQHLTHTEFLLQSASLSFDSRSLTRPWTLKPSKPRKSASVHLPRAGVRSNITQAFVWVLEIKLQPWATSLPSYFFLTVMGFLFHLQYHPVTCKLSSRSHFILCIFLYRSFSQNYVLAAASLLTLPPECTRPHWLLP